MIERLENNGKIFVAGHRGYMSAYPENTLLSFKKALDIGVDMLEFDLRFSKDNVLMVIHDDSVDRTTRSTGKVDEYRMEELLRMKPASSWTGESSDEPAIPAFRQLCEFLLSYPDVLLNVEIKPSHDDLAAADEAIAILEEYQFENRCVFTSFDAKVISYIHKNYQLKTQGFPKEYMLNFVPGREGTIADMWAVGISMKVLTPELVEQFQKLGILAWCYCPDNDEQVMKALKCGAALMTCNNPEPALRIREKIIQR